MLTKAQRNREYWAKNRTKITAIRRERYATEPVYRQKAIQSSIVSGQKYKTQRRAKRYGLSTELYLKLVNGNCAICGSTGGQERYGKLHIDHDHKTEKVRGALCGWCNKAIGLLRDNPLLAEKAAAYLREALS